MSAAVSASLIPFPRAPVFHGDEPMSMAAPCRLIGVGLATGEAGVAIATPEHLAVLQAHLAKRGIDLAMARHEQRYFPLPAERILRDFMEDGWPDGERFERVIVTLVEQAGQGRRSVRAFSQMPALLRSRGNTAAAVRLERLWNQLCKRERVLLV
jgi:hypothetical protein